MHCARRSGTASTNLNEKPSRLSEFLGYPAISRLPGSRHFCLKFGIRLSRYRPRLDVTVVSDSQTTTFCTCGRQVEREGNGQGSQSWSRSKESPDPLAGSGRREEIAHPVHP